MEFNNIYFFCWTNCENLGAVCTHACGVVSVNIEIEALQGDLAKGNDLGKKLEVRVMMMNKIMRLCADKRDENDLVMKRKEKGQVGCEGVENRREIRRCGQHQREARKIEIQITESWTHTQTRVASGNTESERNSLPDSLSFGSRLGKISWKFTPTARNVRTSIHGCPKRDVLYTLSHPKNDRDVHKFGSM